MTANITLKVSDRRQRHKAGYTLAELLVVMIILALLGTLVAPMVFNQIGRSKSRTADTQISSLVAAVGLYRLDVGGLPDAASGLDALVGAPSGVTGWAGPYLAGNRGVPNDPWGNPYVYEYVGPSHAIIRTFGRDAREGGEGEDADISREIR